MAEELPTSPSGVEVRALRAGALTFPHALGLGIAYLGLGAQLVFAPVAFVGASGAGSWLAIVVAAPVLACLGIAISTFSRRFVVSGSLMSYLGEAFGPRSRDLTGICLLVGYVISLCVTAVIALIYVQGLLVDFEQNWATGGYAQLGICALVLAFAAFVSSTGATRSAQVAIVLGVLAVPFAVILAVGIVARQGLDLGPQLRLDGVTSSAIVAGVVIMFGAIVGFEGVTALASETEDPKRNVPRLISALLAIEAGVFLIATLVVTPVLLANRDALFAGESPTSILAGAAGLDWMRMPLNATLAVAFIACLVPAFNDASRVFATAAADGILPARLSRVSAKTHTPGVAIGTLAISTVGVLFAAQLVADQSPLELFVSLVPSMVYLWLVPYTAICLGAVALMRREGKLVSLVALAGVAGAAAMCFIMVYSVTHAVGKVQQISPWICLGAVAVLFGLQTLRETTVGGVEPVAPGADVV